MIQPPKLKPLQVTSVIIQRRGGRKRQGLGNTKKRCGVFLDKKLFTHIPLLLLAEDVQDITRLHPPALWPPLFSPDLLGTKIAPSKWVQVWVELQVEVFITA